MTELNYEEDVAIDLDNLHEEWRTHASIRQKYAAEVSYCERVVKQAHENVKVVRSKLIRQCKKINKGFTAPQVEGWYREHEKHIKAKDDHIEAEYELSMAWNALKAMDDRKFALENEVELWKRDYFSTPSESRSVEGGKKIVDMGRDKTTTQSREAVNKTDRVRKRKRKK